MRRALGQALADALATVGVLGLNRSCTGATTSGAGPASLFSWGLRTPGLAAAHSLRTAAAPTPSLPSAIQELQRLSPGQGAGWLSPLGLYSQAAVRGYKSNKRSLKRLNSAASWKAVEPLIQEYQQQQELQGSQPGSGPAGQASGRRRGRLRARGPVVDSCLPQPIPQPPVPEEYARVGVITGPYSLAQERVFAVVQIAGTQFKVRLGFSEQACCCGQQHSAEDRVKPLLGSRHPAAA
jgi:large subunit ribosomal protein L21